MRIVNTAVTLTVTLALTWAVAACGAGTVDDTKAFCKLAATSSQSRNDAQVDAYYDAIDPLVAALKDANWYVRQEAVKGLQAIGDARAVKPLLNALEDTDKDVRSAAARALVALGSTEDPDADGEGL